MEPEPSTEPNGGENPPDDALREEQEGKGYGADPGEREQALDDGSSPDDA